MRPSSYGKYVDRVERVTAWLGDVRVAALRPEQIATWQTELLKSLSASTVADTRATLRSILSEAVRLEMISTNPVERVRPPTVRAKPRRALTAAESRALVAAAAGDRLGAAVALLFVQGWRVSEVLGLAWSDIDFDAASATVVRASVYADGVGMMLGPPKSEGAKGLHHLSPVVEQLRRRRIAQDAERLRAGASWIKLTYQDQAALANAQATAAGGSPPSTPPASTTTTTLVPPGTINRVKQAEADLAQVSEGITDSTPLVQATASYNSAALALEVAWLKLLVDAGCVTDEQQAQAVAQLTDYTAAVQTQLQQAGYYQAPVDGIYGPQTVAAVQQLQTDSGLPTTGFVDQATALALDRKLAAVGQQAAEQALTQTAAVQTMLKLTGYWTGPIDGTWTPELTEALKSFQTALGVPPTGTVDAPTLAALEQALAKLKAAVTTPPTTTTTTTPTTIARTTTTTTGTSTT